MSYPAVAYNDVDGSGFLGSTVPWIISDFAKVSDAQEKVDEFRSLGYKDVTLFEHPEDDERETELDEISWDYVMSHTI